MDREEIIKNLGCVEEDCTAVMNSIEGEEDGPEMWDLDDYHNWEAMRDSVRDAIDYIRAHPNP
jgi:hypothetical protein